MVLMSSHGFYVVACRVYTLYKDSKAQTWLQEKCMNKKLNIAHEDLTMEFIEVNNLPS
jgi:hypothetical protein